MSAAPAPAGAVTIAAALAQAAARLQRASDTPHLDAEVLLADLLGTSRGALRAAGDDALPAAAQRAFDQRLARRAGGEPVAYITGIRDFWSLRLRVTPDVLVPRPESELLIEWALELLAGARAAELSLADLGTGSGALALALAAELRGAHIVATDRSPAALAVARANAGELGLAVSFAEGDWGAALAPHRRAEGFDVIVCNPPYVGEGDPHLSELRFEPQAALVAGPDGLRELARVAAQAPSLLRPGGWLLLEHGATQGEAVRERMRHAGLIGVTTRRDLAGHERATGGQRA